MAATVSPSNQTDVTNDRGTWDELVKPIRDSIEVKSYVGGLVKSFERKAA